MVELDYLRFDGDNHYYETRDAFTRHMEPKCRDKAVQVVRDAAGNESIRIGEKPFTFLDDMELNFDVTLRPGSLRDSLRYLTGENAASDDGIKQPVQPAYIHRDARLALMDKQRLESAFLFPTLAVCVEHFKRHVYVSPYHEEDVAHLSGLIGADHVVFGSDFPHPEGLEDPVDFAHSCEKMSAEDTKLVMRDNQRRLVGLDT